MLDEGAMFFKISRGIQIYWDVIFKMKIITFSPYSDEHRETTAIGSLLKKYRYRVLGKGSSTLLKRASSCRKIHLSC